MLACLNSYIVAKFETLLFTENGSFAVTYSFTEKQDVNFFVMLTDKSAPVVNSFKGMVVR